MTKEYEERPCVCGQDKFNERHVIFECDLTQGWRTLLGDHDLSDTISKLKQIQATPGIGHRVQARVKRNVIAPIYNLTKAVYGMKSPTDTRAAMEVDCNELAKFIRSGSAALTFLGTDLEQVQWVVAIPAAAEEKMP